MDNYFIYTIIRMTPDTKSPISGDMSRPSWFNKEAVFRSLYETKDEKTVILVLFDGDPTNHWIQKYSVSLLKIQAGTGDLSFATLLTVTKQLPITDSDIIYICEDDYVHRPNWPTILREGLGKMNPSHIQYDYITLYDHLDKYYLYDDFLKKLYSDLKSQISISKSVHWRTTPAITNTYALKRKTFLEDYDILMKYKNSDFEAFTKLNEIGRCVGSCIPGYSTHCQKDFITPMFDWNEYIKKYV